MGMLDFIKSLFNRKKKNTTDYLFLRLKIGLYVGSLLKYLLIETVKSIKI